MTKPFITTLFILLFISFMLFTGCKKDEPTLTEQERVSETLISAAGWQSPVVTIDGIDYSSLYKDFSITFSTSTYTSTGGAPVWKSSGSWKFVNEDATMMKLDDVQEVEINVLPGDFIELSLQWNEDTFIAGRINSVKGKQKFKLKKK